MKRWSIWLILLILLLPVCALAEEDLRNYDLTRTFTGGTLASGHYTMVDDVTLTDSWHVITESDLGGLVIVQNQIELDLNGHELKVTGEARILIDGGIMTVTDSKGDGRVIGELQPNQDRTGDYLFVVSNSYDETGKRLASGVLKTKFGGSSYLKSDLGLLYIDNPEDVSNGPSVSFSGGRYVADLSAENLESFSGGLVVNHRGTMNLSDDAELSLSLGSFQYAYIDNLGQLTADDAALLAGLINRAE